MSVVPSSPHPNEAGHARGRRIEERLLRELEAAKRIGRIATYCQPDALVLRRDGSVFLVEGKGQDMFVAPPFDGHGLPVDQARRYAQIHLATRLRTLFVVYDEYGRVHQYLDALEDGERFDTPGTVKTPRRIYRIDGFNRY